MKRKVTVRPGRAGALAGGIVGIFFVIIGFLVVVPQAGLFGIMWTAVAVFIAGSNLYNAFSEKGIASHTIEIDDDVITGRMSGRRTCTKCGATYHITANPPAQEGICDFCGAELTIRKDDAPETVRKRLEVYHASTEVLKDYYAKLGKLRLVNGEQSIEAANAEILAAIGAKA